MIDEWPQTYCKTCGAKPGEACITSGGNIASNPHKQRPAEDDARLAPRTRKPDVPVSARREVNRRSNGRCEVIDDDGVRCPDRVWHLHHKRLRSLGGRDTPDNLLGVCNGHHRRIHENVAWAIERGYLIDAEAAARESEEL